MSEERKNNEMVQVPRGMELRCFWKRTLSKKGRGVKMVKSVSPQRRRGRRGITFLFGGERPPNKKPSSMPDHAVLATPGDEAQLRI